MNKMLNSTFSGQTLLHRPAAGRVVCSRGSVQVFAAQRKANWVLDQPKRLWEIGSELW